MSLKIKHLEALETKDYCQKTLEKSIDNIDNDKSGTCWHIEETKRYSYEQAKKLDSMPQHEKENMPLFGLKVGIKDLFCINGLTTTAGSKILENFISPYDSDVWNTLKSKGALLSSKLAMDEFAMGSFSNTSYLGRVSIPNHLDRTAGGSSGGSASALVADIADFTVGSDTGGSVRLPASYCSVVGYKPSYGAFSRYGMIAYASSLDQAGFLTKDIEDLNYLLSSHISSSKTNDKTCVGLGDFIQTKEKKLVYGYFPEMLTDKNISEEVQKAYFETLEKIKQAGNEIKPISVEYMKEAVNIYYIIACSEACSNLSKYQGIYFGKKLIEENFKGSFWEQAAQYRSKYFGIEVQKRIMLGSYVLSSENYDSIYNKAKSLRKILKESFIKIFNSVDTLVLPVSTSVSPKWTEIEKMTTEEIYMADYMTVPFSLAGLPAISLPLHKNKDGLGIGIQFVGKYLNDYELVKQLGFLNEKI